MKEYGIFDAKTRFSEVVKHVRDTAQAVRITNRGEGVVDIVPVSDTGNRRSKRTAFKLLAQFRLDLPRTTLAEIRADIAEGRR